MVKGKYFFCYNSKLSKFLDIKGIDYITKAQHPASKQIFSLYEKDDELLKAIEHYKEVFKHEN